MPAVTTGMARRATILLALLLGGCAQAATHGARLPLDAAHPHVDAACRVDADCTVKDVGNCCGRYPACVNRDSPTFPARVKAECGKKGMVGVCGFPVIRGCRCIDGRCGNLTGIGSGPGS
jgi:hypothetical protein